VKTNFERAPVNTASLLHFQDFLEVQSDGPDLLLEMGRYLHVEKDKVAFDDGDIRFLYQFPRRFWSRALKIRYCDLLIEALKEREGRREKAKQELKKKFYDENLPAELGRARYRQGVHDKRNLDIESRVRNQVDQQATAFAQYKVESDPKYSEYHDASPEYDRMVFEFDDNIGKDNGLKKTVKIVADTGINDMLHRLETIKGRRKSYKSRDARGNLKDRTILGRLGFYLWGAQRAQQGMPAHTGGMLMLNHLATARLKLSQWINASAEGLLDSSGDNDSPTVEAERKAQQELYRKNPNDPRVQTRWGADEDGSNRAEELDLDDERTERYLRNAGAGHFMLYDRLAEPVEDYFYRLLSTKDADKGYNGPRFEKVKEVVDALPDLEKHRPKSLMHPDDRERWAELLARGYLWLKAKKQGHPEHPYDGSDTSRGKTVTIYTTPGKYGEEGGQVRLWMKPDGYIVPLHPPVKTHLVRNAVTTLQDDGKGNVKEVQEKDHWHPILHPGREMAALPHWLWKKDAQMAAYHGDMQKHSEKFDALDRQKVMTGGEEGDESAGRGQSDEFKKNATEAHAVLKHSGNAPQSRGNSIFPLYNATVKREGDKVIVMDPKGEHEIAELPTYGRFGEYVERPGKDSDLYLKQFEKAVTGDPTWNGRPEDHPVLRKIAQEATEQYEREQEGAERKASSGATAKFWETIYKEKLKDHLKDLPGPEPLDAAVRNANSLSSFFKQLGDHIQGGHHPNKQARGAKPLPQGSEEAKEVENKLYDPETGMKQGFYGKHGDKERWKPIMDGVLTGIRIAEDKYGTPLAEKLMLMADDLYQDGLNWLNNNLGDPKLLEVPKTRDSYIKYKVVGRVLNTAQLDLGELGTRRLRGRGGRGVIVSTDKDIPGAEGSTAGTIGDNLGVDAEGNRTGYSALRDMMNFTSKRGRQDRFVRLSPDMKSIDESIRDVARRLGMLQAMADSDNPDLRQEHIKEKLFDHNNLYRLIEEKYKMPPHSLTGEALHKAAMAEFVLKLKDAGVIKDDQGVSRKDLESVNPSDLEESEDFKLVKDNVDELSEKFQKPEDVRAMLDDPERRRYWEEWFDADAEEAWEAIDILTKSSPHRAEIKRMFESMQRKASDQQARVTLGQEFHRGAKAVVHTYDSYMARTKTQRLLADPSKNEKMLSEPSVLRTPDFYRMIDRKIAQLSVAPDRGEGERADLDALFRLRDKAVAHLISPHLVLAADTLDVKHLRTALEDPVGNRAYLSRPEILAHPRMADLIQQRRQRFENQVRDDPDHADRAQEGIRMLGILASQIKGLGGRVVTSKEVEAGTAKAATGMTPKDLATMLEDPVHNKIELLQGQAALQVPGAKSLVVSAYQNAVARSTGRDRAEYWPVLSLLSKVKARFEKLPETKTAQDKSPVPAGDIYDVGGKFSDKFYKPVRASDPFVIAKNPEWTAADLPSIRDHDPLLSDGDKATEFTDLMRRHVPGPEEDEDFWPAGGMERVDLPQITGKGLALFQRYMAQLGVQVTNKQVPPGMITPSQRRKDLNPEKMLAAFKDETPNPVVVAPNRKLGKYIILDGHHTWAGKAAQEIRYGVHPLVNAMVVNMEFGDLLSWVKKFMQPDGQLLKRDDFVNGPFSRKGKYRQPGDLPTPPVDKPEESKPAASSVPTVAPAAPPLPDTAKGPQAKPAGPAASSVPTVAPAAPPLPDTAKGPTLNDLLGDPVKYQSELMRHPEFHPNNPAAVQAVQQRKKHYSVNDPVAYKALNSAWKARS
jgi:hypothetical protein